MGHTTTFFSRSLEKLADPRSYLYLLKIENRTWNHTSAAFPRLRQTDWNVKRQRVKKHDNYVILQQPQHEEFRNKNYV